MRAIVLFFCMLASAAGAEEVSIPASAQDHSGTAYWEVGRDLAANLFEETQGSFDLTVVDKVHERGAVNGDEAKLHVSLKRGVDRYEIDLRQVGFPQGGAPPVALEGGVLLNTDVYGFTGRGPSLITQTRAAISVWGTATVSFNGQATTDEARVFVAALDKGVHADDGSFRMLNQGRLGDTELLLIVDHLPASIDPRGFIEIGFEDVDIDVNGARLPKSMAVDSVASEEEGSASPGTGGSGTGGYAGGGGGGGIPTPFLGTLPGATSPAAGVATATTVNTTNPTTAEVLGPESLTPGIPASPVVLNSSGLGSPTPLNATAATPLPSAPAPANASPATALISTPQPLNAAPATSAVPVHR